jgi:hypothetical protein
MSEIVYPTIYIALYGIVVFIAHYIFNFEFPCQFMNFAFGFEFKPLNFSIFLGLMCIVILCSFSFARFLIFIRERSGVKES